MSAKFTRSVFEWLDQVALDKNVPSSAFRVAYVIAQHINEETEEAWPSTETIGDLGGLYPSSVRAMIVKLVEHGHLAVVWGRKGRGHPNRYSMIAKPQQAAVSSSGKPQRAAVLASRTKPQPSELKPQPDDHKTAAGCHEPLRNHLKNHKRAASPPTPPVLLESVTDHRERAYAALWEVYPNKTYPHDGPEAFGQLLDEGIDADDLIAEAKRYATKCSGMNGKNIPFLCFWLRVEAKPALEASRLLNMGRAGKLARTTGDDNGIAPKAHAGKIYDSHYEAAYGPEP